MTLPAELLTEPTTRYTCAACGEDQVLWVADPPADGVCPDCTRARAGRRETHELLAACGVPPKLCRAREVLRAGRPVPRAAAEWRGEPPMLLLHGPTGDGKSTLAAALLGELLERGHRPAYVEAGRLMLELGEEYSGERRGVLRRYIGAGALVLDDLGTEPMRRDTAASLGLLIDQRWSSGRPTIVTTNLSLARPRRGGKTLEVPSLEDYDPRLVSRLVSGLVVALGPDDLRLAGGSR